MNLFEQQAANRRKSRWLVAAFVLFFAWLGFGGDYLAWEMTRYGPPGAYRHAFPWGGVALFAIAHGHAHGDHGHGAHGHGHGGHDHGGHGH